jgi:ABC-type Fe3+ transport system permease subunit
MGSKSWMRWLGITAALSVFLALPRIAFAQNCALCYTQAASTGARMIQALRSGILVLIIPPTLGSIGMIFLVHRRSNQFKRDDAAEPGQDW